MREVRSVLEYILISEAESYSSETALGSAWPAEAARGTVRNLAREIAIESLPADIDGNERRRCVRTRSRSVLRER
jgi:hypothetical protein